jgi:2-iminobutanoate/2-iminopropanoate deaminase
MKIVVEPAGHPASTAPLSPGIIANGFLYVSGFGPHDPATGSIPDGVAEQTRAVLTNISAVLAEAGLDLSDVVKVTSHLQHLVRDFAEYNAVYAELVPEPRPVRTTVGSDLMNILVEIDVVAALRADR